MKSIPLHGISMTPVLKSGDSLFVDWNHEKISIGDIVVLVEPDRTLSAHRIISLVPFLAKGDRNREVDLREQNLKGIVVGYKRNGIVVYWGERGQLLKEFLAFLSRQSRLEYETIFFLAKRFLFLKLIIIIAWLDEIIGRSHYQNRYRNITGDIKTDPR